MSQVQQEREPPYIHRFGALLVTVALIAVLVAYPPLSTGSPLVSIGSIFLPLSVSIVALFFALVGGLLLGRNLAAHQARDVSRVAIRVLIPVSAVVIIGAYLVVIAGFDLA